WMVLQVPVKREPFRPPVREPLPETESEPDQTITSTAAEAPVTSNPAADAPVVDSADVTRQSQEELPPPATAIPAAPPAATEPAAVEPADAEPADASTAAANPPPDDFGAGLTDSAANPHS